MESTRNNQRSKSCGNINRRHLKQTTSDYDWYITCIQNIHMPPSVTHHPRVSLMIPACSPQCPPIGTVRANMKLDYPQPTIVYRLSTKQRKYLLFTPLCHIYVLDHFPYADRLLIAYLILFIFGLLGVVQFHVCSRCQLVGIAGSKLVSWVTHGGDVWQMGAYECFVYT